ncbi:MAG: methionyl-tRNA formyltransferase [Candidatus Pacebacteria bacterium]|nr:methionyl-tRNA formyltransferase [Candidatus Paceibacterota bacterium]MBP9772892.1 methionyl-tRNA formyltransferase [Candidatus Paceibacterota bacterium]
MDKKFVFFGTPELASVTLEILKSRGFLPALVVTSPDKPIGRHFEITPTPVKVWAEKNNIPLLTPEKIDEKFMSEIKSHELDLGIVVAYGKIFSEELINLFPLGVLNIHYSLLPKYRGASPVESAILNQDTETGVTIQKMARKMDTGPILAMSRAEIDSDETTPHLRERLTHIGAELLADTIPEWLDGKIIPIEQNHENATYCKKISKDDGEIKLSDEPKIKYAKYKAYFTWPGIYFFDENNRRIKITKARFENGEFIIERVIPEGKKETDYKI